MNRSSVLNGQDLGTQFTVYELTEPTHNPAATLNLDTQQRHRSVATQLEQSYSGGQVKVLLRRDLKVPVLGQEFRNVRLCRLRRDGARPLRHTRCKLPK